MPAIARFFVLSLLLTNASPLDAQRFNRWRPGIGAYAGMSAPAGSLGTIEGVEGNATAGAIIGLTGSLATARWEFAVSADRSFGSGFVTTSCDPGGNCSRDEVDANLLTMLLEVGYRPIANSRFLLLGGFGLKHHLDAVGVNCVCRPLATFANPSDQLVWRGGIRLEKPVHRRVVMWGDGSVNFTSFQASNREQGDRYNTYADFRLSAGVKFVRSRTDPTRPAQ